MQKGCLYDGHHLVPFKDILPPIERVLYMKATLLSHILTTHVTTFSPEYPVGDALESMTAHHISSLIVVDTHHRPIGIFTERDSLKIVSGEISTTTPLCSVMSTDLLLGAVHDEIHDAYRKMANKGYRHLIVVDEEEKLAGIVSQGDFLRHIGFDTLKKVKIVSDIMTKAILRLEKNDTLTFAATQMAQSHSDYAIIVDNMSPIGLITERDILRYASSESLLPSDPIWRAYHTEFPIIHENTSLSEATLIMEQHDVHQLIIVDEVGNLTGILSRYDLLEAIHGSYFEFLLNQVESKSNALSQLSDAYEQISQDKEALLRSEEKFRILFDMVPDGIVLIDPATHQSVDCNLNAAKQLGYTIEEFHNLTINDYNALETHEETQERIHTILHQKRYEFDTLHRHKNGSLLDIHVTVSPVFLWGNTYLMSYYHDITERRKREHRLNAQLSLLETLATNHSMETLLDAISLFVEGQCQGIKCSLLLVDEATQTLYTASAPSLPSAYVETVNGLPIAYGNGSCGTACALRIPVIVTDVMSDPFWESLREAITPFNWLQGCWSTPFFDTHKQLLGAFALYSDQIHRYPTAEEQELMTYSASLAGMVIGRFTQQKALEYLANYDPLTGLANRFLLQSHLKKTIETAQNKNLSFALLLFDLDRFKDINDSFGHTTGDELLTLVAKRFAHQLGENDTISRLGGDEFAILLSPLSHREDASNIARILIETLQSPFSLSNGVQLHISASGGIALFPAHGNSAEELIQHADAALYRAKSEGRNTYCYYTNELTQISRDRLLLEAKLRFGIDNNELRVFYQPQVDLSSGKIIGAEALVRWHHPTEGIIPPLDFIPLAEETGLINKIGAWVLEETCHQGKIWFDQGYRLTLAVNLSVHQMRYQNIPALVSTILEKTHYPAHYLELEITESALMQREEESVAILHTLRAMGVRLAIDDFGTGYSSLSYLKRFPIDVLKIDKSFVDNTPLDSDNVAITIAIIAMAKALNFTVLAEGVEKQEQLDFLHQNGCDLYQGYYKSRPLPATEFEKLLR